MEWAEVLVAVCAEVWVAEWVEVVPWEGVLEEVSAEEVKDTKVIIAIIGGGGRCLVVMEGETDTDGGTE